MTSLTEGGDTVAAAVRAHGGLQRWHAISQISADVAIGGQLWASKGHDGVLSDAHVTVDTRRQRVVFDGFGSRRWRSVLDAGRISLYRHDGGLLEERIDPRASFPADATAGWDELQVAYFASYAIWNYLMLPFLLTWKGFGLQELPPWPGTDHTWRRVRVDFPRDIDTHTSTQFLNFDANGLLVRHDYDADLLGGAPATNAASAFEEHDGIVFATHRYVTARDSRGGAAAEPLLVSIDFDGFQLR
jgi:hypothetical protein